VKGPLVGGPRSTEKRYPFALRRHAHAARWRQHLSFPRSAWECRPGALRPAARRRNERKRQRIWKATDCRPRGTPNPFLFKSVVVLPAHQRPINAPGATLKMQQLVETSFQAPGVRSTRMRRSHPFAFPTFFSPDQG
jgi:hypothetical protein